MKYKTRPIAAAVPMAGSAKPARSPTAPQANNVPSGTIHLRETRTRSATILTDSAPMKFKQAA
jgi:hypothetical protein